MNAQPAPCGAPHPDDPGVTCERAAHHRGEHSWWGGGEQVTWPRAKTTKRGTSNSDARGSSYDRARRRAKLVAAWPADYSLLFVFDQHGVPDTAYPIESSAGDAAVAELLEREYAGWFIEACTTIKVPTARCYCCGYLLHAGVELPDGTTLEGTVTCDRIVPGAEGGTYVFSNLRPACAAHNSSTGGRLGVARKAAARVARTSS